MDEVYGLLRLEPSLPKLLQARAFAKPFPKRFSSRRPTPADPLQPPRRFLRPLGKEAAVGLLGTPATGESRVIADDTIVASIFSADEVRVENGQASKTVGKTHVRFVTSATTFGIEKCVAAAVAHQDEMGLPIELKSSAALTTKSLLPNLLSLATKGEPIEVAQTFEHCQLTLAIRTPGLATARRIGTPTSTLASRRLIEADLPNRY